MTTITLGSLFDGLYLISNVGDLFSVRSNKYLKPSTDRYGYKYFVISINSSRMTLKAHRLVAQTFIPNPLDKPTVNHKNGVRHDNRVSNLEWATAKEQARDPLTYAKISALAKTTDYAEMGRMCNFGRKPTAVYHQNQLLGVYGSLKDAAKQYDANYAKASECANGKRRTAGGVRFAYVG